MKSLLHLLGLPVLLLLAWSPALPKPLASNSPPAPSQGAPWTTGATGVLPDPNFGPGQHEIDLRTTGEYRAADWIVVLDYQSFTVNAGATVRFINHESRAPVVIQAVGEIVIDGNLDLDGAQGASASSVPTYAEPGPGGFRGGRGRYLATGGESAGMGPGGGFLTANGAGPASHQTLATGQVAQSFGPTYGSPSVVPLIGGSGGSAFGGSSGVGNVSSGGAGGGAILIGSNSKVTLRGNITARGGSGNNCLGGSGPGSGGAIRIVAPQVQQLSGHLDARGWGHCYNTSGDGVVRIEVDGGANITLAGQVLPDPVSTSVELGEFIPQSVPRVALHSYFDPDAGPSGEWKPVPQDPRAVIFHPSLADVQLQNPGPTIFRVEGKNIPIRGAVLHVRTTHTRGQAVVDSSHVMGEEPGSTFRTSYTHVEIDLTGGVSAIQVRVELP